MRDWGASAALALLLAVVGCAPAVRLPAGTPPSEREIVLNNHTLRLHLANPHAPAGRPLLVFATGDGGWHRKDLDAWKHLVSWGYPVVGFDARDYVTHLGQANAPTTPARLAADYARIIAAARESLTLGPEHRVVLVGVSRGAGLSVVAAGAASMHAEVDGVLAVALTREEEYVHWYSRHHARARDEMAALEMVQLYEYLPTVGDTPVAVVQSTRDHYLPAAEARELFGPNTPRRHFEAIEARNHSFGGARQDLYRAMSESLDWIDAILPSR